MYKIGFCQKEYMTWENAIDFAVRHGFQHVELECEFIGHNEKVDEKYINHIAQKAFDNNLTLSLHCVNGINLVEKVYFIRQASIEIMKRSIDLAHKLNAKWITTHLGVSGALQRDNDEIRMQIAYETIRELIEYSDNIKICIENLQKIKEGSYKHYFGSELSELQGMKKNIPKEELFFTLDIGHININNSKEIIRNMINEINNNIVAVHIHSNNGLKDQHLAFQSGVMNEWIMEEYARELSQKCLLVECYSLRDIILSKKRILTIMGGM